MPQSFPIKCYIEKPWIEELSHVKITSIFVSGTKQENVSDDDTEADTITFKRFKREILIQPGDCLDIAMSYTMIKEVNGTKVWKAIYPGNNMTLAVRFPREVKVVDAHSVHRVPLKKVEEVKEGGFYSWRIDKPILPHQGIVFWWRCRAGDEEVKEQDQEPRSLDGEMSEGGQERAIAAVPA